MAVVTGSPEAVPDSTSAWATYIQPSLPVEVLRTDSTTTVSSVQPGTVMSTEEGSDPLSLPPANTKMWSPASSARVASPVAEKLVPVSEVSEPLVESIVHPPPVPLLDSSAIMPSMAGEYWAEKAEDGFDSVPSCSL